MAVWRHTCDLRYTLWASHCDLLNLAYANVDDVQLCTLGSFLLYLSPVCRLNSDMLSCFRPHLHYAIMQYFYCTSASLLFSINCLHVSYRKSLHKSTLSLYMACRPIKHSGQD